MRVVSANPARTYTLLNRESAEFIRFITKWREEFVIVPSMERILN